MADKQSAATLTGDVATANVTTTGTVVAGTVSVLFNTDDSNNDISAMIEKARLQIIQYFQSHA